MEDNDGAKNEKLKGEGALFPTTSGCSTKRKDTQRRWAGVGKGSHGSQRGYSQ